MIAAAITYLKARWRMRGKCPPHRHEDETGKTFAFCLDCGTYR